MSFSDPSLKSLIEFNKLPELISHFLEEGYTVMGGTTPEEMWYER